MHDVIDLDVGGDPVVGTGGDVQLQGWLKQLGRKVEQQKRREANQEQQQLLELGPSASTSMVPPISQQYEHLTKTLLLHIRDQAQQRLASAFAQQMQTLGVDTPSQWEPALLTDELANIILESPVSLDEYHGTQAQLSAALQHAQELQKQWQALPIPAEELPQTRSTLVKLLESWRQGHSEWMGVTRATTEKLWRLRVDLVEAYSLLTSDAVQQYLKESQRVMDIYKEVQGEINRQIQLAEDTEFFHDFKRLHDMFTFWVHSISELLPSAIRFHQQVDGFLQSCDMTQDPCCLRRVQHLSDQVERIQSVLVLHRDSQQYQKMQSDTLSQELQMTTSEWTQTQSQLEQVQRELTQLSGRRTQLWAQDHAVPELERLEQHQRNLEQKQSQLLEKLTPLRATLERLRAQNSELVQHTQLFKALEQAQEWHSKLRQFQARCEKESVLWNQGRGLQYRARQAVQDETRNTLLSLYNTSQQKVDGAGLALVRYGLIVVQNIWTSAALPHHAWMQRSDATLSSLAHYIQRLSLSNPNLAELLHQQIKAEQDVQHIRQDVEEMQLRNFVYSIWKPLYQKYHTLGTH